MIIQKVFSEVGVILDCITKKGTIGRASTSTETIDFIATEARTKAMACAHQKLSTGARLG